MLATARYTLCLTNSLGELGKMVQLRKVYSSGRGRAYVDASVALEEEELMPEERAVLKMIHSTNYD